MHERMTIPEYPLTQAQIDQYRRDGFIQLDDVVVIAGVGPLGLGMVAAARLKNPRLLIAIDMSEDRLEIARLCGADLTLNPGKVDVIDEVMKLTDNYGCDVYIEATGYPAAVEQGLRMIRKLGTFVEFSVMRERRSVWYISTPHTSP